MEKKIKNDDINGWVGLAALAVGGYALVRYGLPLFNPPDRLKENSEQESVYAYVKNPEGALLFTKTAQGSEPLIGHGREPLAKKLDYGYYVGKLTGLTFRELAQVSTSIDNKEVSFWINKDDIGTGTKDQFNENGLFQNSKPQAVLQELLHSIIN